MLFRKCAVSTASCLETPLGDLAIDQVSSNKRLCSVEQAECIFARGHAVFVQPLISLLLLGTGFTTLFIALCGMSPQFQDITRQLLATGHFDVLTPSVDEDEHSIEMHLPFIKKVFGRKQPTCLLRHHIVNWRPMPDVKFLSDCGVLAL